MLRENVQIAMGAIKANLLRSVLTMLIIAVGITALVGILTAIDSIKQSINSNFSSMGANTFTIRNRELSIRIGKKGKKPKKFRAITFEEGSQFKEQFSFPALVSLSTMAGQGMTIKYKGEKTNPNISIFGSDENYVSAAGYEISRGRNYSLSEVQMNAPVVIIGYEIARKLFPGKKNPLDEIVSVGDQKMRVIGVLKEKGASMSMGGDKVVIIPISYARQKFLEDETSYTINVVAGNPAQMDVAISEGEGLFRKIRKVGLGQEDNFEILKSDSLAGLLIDNISYVTMAATIIGLITLLGAAIGLMNIMMVSVTERTREIGIRMSLGATRKSIRTQFLVEAIVICQLGGIIGIILGIITGNFTSFAVGAGFIIPWLWISSGFFLCFFVGIVAGFYPAAKAAKLDPVEALRYE
jgi:putative ABC transport system permease protein